MNTKVERLLDAMAIVLKDENPKLIAKLHEVINDKRDGYEFDFIAKVLNYKSFVKGKSY